MSKKKISNKHIHKYIRVELKFAKVWRCSDPHCNHFMPPHQEGMLIGRASICWNCGGEMILNDFNMQEDQPRCNECIMNTGELVPDIDKLLEQK